ncbi:hypothetical protein NDU88_001938 [Pleurodeles waltl]|uniref:Uncharacterized protein n=1 Tax=Pleurodeles waltl TaxID=8319 RepID=A0AAV7TKE6_PLEWA|nr:hypothetical protein NDU88_001938 [Pleurodeles waltl]
MDKAGERSLIDQGTWPDDQIRHATSLAKLMEAIKCARTELATKIDSVAINVNLLTLDLRGVSHRITVMEANMGELQLEVATLRETVF